jgi:[histone H3]-lysine79 N-trimethyltransferase
MSTLVSKFQVAPLLFPSKFHERYLIVAPKKRNEVFDPCVDVINAIKFISEDFEPIFSDNSAYRMGSIIDEMIDFLDEGNYGMLGKKVFEMSAIIAEYLTISPDEVEKLRKKPLTRYQSDILLEQVYARTITKPRALTSKLKGFSKEVYGETGPSITSDMIKMCGITENSVFLDLGCGIGNVVLQVAAETRCASYGVELLEIPFLNATAQLKEFNARLALYGRGPVRVEIFQDDFLEAPHIIKLMEEADVIFVNK